MPVIKSAKKKLRQDKKREIANQLLRKKIKVAIKDAQKSKTGEKIKTAVRNVDKGVKKGLMHKNKAARIKSKLSKLTKHATNKPKTVVKPTTKTKSPKSKK